MLSFVDVCDQNNILEFFSILRSQQEQHDHCHQHRHHYHPSLKTCTDQVSTLIHSFILVTLLTKSRLIYTFPLEHYHQQRFFLFVRHTHSHTNSLHFWNYVQFIHGLLFRFSYITSTTKAGHPHFIFQTTQLSSHRHNFLFTT